MEQVCSFHSVDGNNVGSPIVVNVEVLPRAADDFKGALVQLLKVILDWVYPDEDMSAAVEVLADEGLGGRGARLHRLKGLNGVLEAAGEVLDTARPGIRCTGEEFNGQPECGSIDQLSREVAKMLIC